MDLHYDYYDRGKKNVTLVFIHGLGGNLFAWNKIREIMHGHDYSSVAMDLRGHGQSKRSNKLKNYQMDFLADDINKLIKQLKIKKFILVGHCLGGNIASIYQDKYNDALGKILICSSHRSPKRLRALKPFFYLINSFTFNFLPDKDKDYKRIDFSKYKGTSDLSFKRIFSDIKDTGLKSYAAMFYHYVRFNGEEILKKTKVPSLIISSEKDIIFYKKYGRTLNSLIPNSKLVEIPNANHIAILNNPLRIANLINDFVKDKIVLE